VRHAHNWGDYGDSMAIDRQLDEVTFEGIAELICGDNRGLYPCLTDWW
jgi:hypothetical protein